MAAAGYFPPAGAGAMTPPQAQAMTFDKMLEGEGVMLKQLTSLCCRFACFQPNLHWTVHPYNSASDYGFDDVTYNGVWVQEDSSWYDAASTAGAHVGRGQLCQPRRRGGYNDSALVLCAWETHHHNRPHGRACCHSLLPGAAATANVGTAGVHSGQLA